MSVLYILENQEGEFVRYSYTPFFSKSEIDKGFDKKGYKFKSIEVENRNFKENLALLLKEVQTNISDKIKNRGYTPSEFVSKYANGFKFIDNIEESELLLKSLHEAEKWGESI